ncbi:hypothetical protein V5O48_016201 [Marasmius crinis-equi]|uniref:Fungal lipase-type domain-containing protein n=1 Tax=Marasmius crinis-equi TaxID=585013 RepID=A0ABR3ESP2_9AGAR
MLIPVLTDLNILRVPIDPLLFPGAPPGTKVHWGFQLEHERSAERIKLEVAKLMELHKVYKIYTIGHSLGGALAILDALFLSLQFPAASVETIVYGAPHPVPVLPPKWLGFKHPQGELHFAKSGSAVYCDGEDNEIDTQCEDLTVHEPFALTGNVMDHRLPSIKMGPYEGIHIGSIYC